MESPKMDVEDWQNSPLPTLAARRAPGRYLPPSLIGILGTAMLHVILVQSLVFGSGGPKPKPPEAQDFASALATPNPDADNLVLISLPVLANGGQSATENATVSLLDLSKMKIKSPISIDPPAFLNLQTLALSEDPSSTPASGPDGVELARLFGIYTGQIQARIDRIWRRPRTPVNEADQKSPVADESFRCEAQIVQDFRGNVQEVLLPRCNGSPAWQRSLIVAIQQAAPLPGPPSDKVFSKSITLIFVGLSYFAGAPDDEYEPERRTLFGAQ
jgi:hypothetical protein